MTLDGAMKRPVMMRTPDEETVRELTVSIEKQLGDSLIGHDTSAMVRDALNELAPVAVRTYLPVLVERHIRRQLA